jgi:transmembrane sensor
LLAGATAALVAAIILGIAVNSQRGSKNSWWEGAVFEAREHPQSFQLRDGSSVLLTQGSRLEVCNAVAEDICLLLKRGHGEFDVVSRHGRIFLVRAGDAEVKVVGTRFVVERHQGDREDRVQVTVSRGAVQVGARGLPPRRLGTGERWSIGWQVESPPQVGKEVGQNAAPAPVAAPTADTSAAARPRGSAEPAPIDAASLWKDATSARERGDSTAEARAYEELLQQFPRDARTGYAAFELARVRMDAFKEPARALSPLERAVELGPGTTYYEHALARLAEAYAFVGRTADCERLRDRYLASYPSGAHVRFMTSICGTR